MISEDIFQCYFSPAGFFQSWFYRLQWADRSICLIPGVSVGEEPHAFIYIVDSNGQMSHIINYPIAEFSCASCIPIIKIGNNMFSLSKIHLDIESPELSLKGDIYLSDIRTDKCSDMAMGLFKIFDCLEYNTHICATDGRADGEISLNGNPFRLSGAHLYAAKSWGESFPEAYLWIQGRFFAGVSLSLSLGRVPLGAFEMDSMTAVINDECRSYRLNSMCAGNHDIRITPDALYLTAISGRHALKLQAQYGSKLTLPAPVLGDMDGEVGLSLDAKVKFQLYDLDRGTCILRREGERIGLMLGGEWSAEEA